MLSSALRESSVNRFLLSMTDLVPNVMQGIVTHRDVIVGLFSDCVAYSSVRTHTCNVSMIQYEERNAV